jgi:hypothetical protein
MARSRKPCKTVVDSSLTGHAPFAADDDRCASVYASRGRWSEINRRQRFPSGQLPPG